MNGKYIMTGFAIVMLVYTGWRTFDYMSGSLQGVDDTVRLLVAIAFLAFSELGLLLWLHVGKPQATTETQESVATAMIWVDFAGAMLIGLADLAKHNTLYTIDLAAVDPVLFLAPWILVVANVGAYLVYHQADSEEQIERSERRLRHEEAKLDIATRHEAIRQVQQQRSGVAKDLAPLYAADLVNRVNGRTAERFKHLTQAANRKAAKSQAAQAEPAPIPELEEIEAIESPDPKARRNGNGHHGPKNGDL